MTSGLWLGVLIPAFQPPLARKSARRDVFDPGSGPRGKFCSVSVRSDPCPDGGSSDAFPLARREISSLRSDSDVRSFRDAASINNCGEGRPFEGVVSMAIAEVDQRVLWDLERISNSFHLWERSRKDAEENGQEILRECRDALGWTQMQLAARIGVNMYHLSRLMRGHGRVSSSLLSRLHDVIVAEQGKRPGPDPVGGTGAGGPGNGAG